MIFFFKYQNNQYTSKRNLFSDLPLQSNTNAVDKTAEFRVPLQPESITPNPYFKPNVKKILKTKEQEDFLKESLSNSFLFKDFTHGTRSRVFLSRLQAFVDAIQFQEVPENKFIIRQNLKMRLAMLEPIFI